MSTIKASTFQDLNGVERYMARAWVNFNGTGTVAIRAAGNVSSITDNGTGDYTVNFTSGMPDANYGCSFAGNCSTTGLNTVSAALNALAAGTCRLKTVVNGASTNASVDCDIVSVAIFR